MGGMGPLGVGMHPAPSVTSGLAMTRDSSTGTSLYGLSLAAAGLPSSAAASSALSIMSDEQAPSMFALPRPSSLKVRYHTAACCRVPNGNRRSASAERRWCSRRL